MAHEAQDIPVKLADFFRKFKLTAGQSEALQRLESFLAGEKQLFLLKGYAGTGKTFLLGGLAAYLAHIQRACRLMAPTGRASRVIRDKTGREASTIHKAIYDFSLLKEYKVKEEDGSESYRFFFDLRNEYDNVDTVYILDEASMLSDKYNDDEFLHFGSGCLLKDLIKFTGMGAGLKRKLIFVGDNAQLPPVNMNTSPALNGAYIRENYGLEWEEYELTEVLRQQQDSGILHHATMLRNAIRDGIYNSFIIDTDYPDIAPLPVEKIVEGYLSRTGGKVDEQSIIVAHSNSKVWHYNRIMREHFFPGRANVTCGDRVMVVKNNYNYPVEVFNGDIGFVREVTEQTEKRNVPLRKGKEFVPLVFRDIEIEFTPKPGEVVRFPCKIIENLLNSRERDLSADEKKALYIDFKIRHSHLKPGSTLFTEALKKDPYFNCLFLKYGYAVTCHKAQGGEWENAIVDFQSGIGYLTEAYFRWSYTAMTRGREFLFAVNAPQQRLYRDLTPVDGHEQAAVTDRLLVLPLHMREAHRTFDFPAGSEALQRICRAVCHLLEQCPYKVKRIVHHQYCERYHLQGPDDTGMHQLDLYYNKHGIITSIVFPPQAEQAFREEVECRLECLLHREISMGREEEPPGVSKNDADSAAGHNAHPGAVPRFPADKPYLQEFYHHLRERLAEEQIKITGIVHNDYLEKYDFARGHARAGIDFYYNKKGRFTGYKCQQKRSNSGELLQQISDLLADLKDIK